MTDNIKDYAKRSQELAVATKIIDLLNKNKYDNLDDFIKRNPSYQSFLKNNKLDNVITHFGVYSSNVELTEEDFKTILNNLRKLTSLKQSPNTDNIKTTNIGDNQYVNYDGEDEKTNENELQPKTYQKTLTTNSNTIYNRN